MQVIKPSVLSVLHQTYYFKGHQFVIGAMSFFKLGDDNQLLQENEQWPRLQPYLDKKLILDTGHAKACGEVFVAGSAFAPKGKPVSKMKVAIKVAGCEKKLQVIGNRKWSGNGILGLSDASRPEPFTSMSLGPQESYGGVGYDINPDGKGLVNKDNFDAEQNAYHLPNLYLEKESISASRSKRGVACLWPINIIHPQRKKLQGTFDKQWQEKVCPGFPDDTDPRYFNAAPADQQLKGFIDPGQEYHLEGMHPELPILTGKIPEMKVRAFVSQESTQESEEKSDFKEIDMQIDTLWLFPELEMGIAIHRGVLPANDSAGLDIKNLMLAMERKDDKFRPLSYFQNVRDLRLNKNTSVGHMFNASQLLPAHTAQESAQRKKWFQGAKQLLLEKNKKLAAQMLKQFQNEPSDIDWDSIIDEALLAVEKDSESVPPPIPQELLDKADFDLTPFIEWGKELFEKSQANAKKLQEELDAELAKKPLFPPAPESDDSIQARVDNVVRVLTDTALAQNGEQQDPMVELDQMSHKAERQARQTAPDLVFPDKVLPEHGPALLRQKIIKLIAAGESLVGRDLAGADLSGLDLGGIDFRDVMLEQANLSNANFTGCLFDGAVFTDALIENSILAGCSFVSANFSNVKCRQSRFSESVFERSVMLQSQFNQCDFSGAKFSHIQTMGSNWEKSLFNQAELQEMQWVESDLNRTCWKQAKLIQCNLLQCQYQESDWQQAFLFRCVMVKSEAQKANFFAVSAKITQFSTEGDFTGADFSSGNWEQCGFRGLNLNGANLSASVFKSCDFGDADLTSAKATGALFQNSLLFQARFHQSDCSAVVFYQSNLRKATFENTSLRSATIEQTNLREAVFRDCDTNQLKQSSATVKVE